jgi:hypothetical protein
MNRKDHGAEQAQWRAAFDKFQSRARKFGHTDKDIALGFMRIEPFKASGHTVHRLIPTDVQAQNRQLPQPDDITLAVVFEELRYCAVVAPAHAPGLISGWQLTSDPDPNLDPRSHARSFIMASMSVGLHLEERGAAMVGAAVLFLASISSPLPLEPGCAVQYLITQLTDEYYFQLTHENADSRAAEQIQAGEIIGTELRIPRRGD